MASACVTVASDGPSDRLALASQDEPAAAASASAAPGLVESAQPVPATDGTGESDDNVTTVSTELDGPVSTAEPTIGYIALDASQAFVQTISEGLREAAADAGIDLIECDSGWTRPGVDACAADLAKAGVSGVISMQPFPDLTEAVCETLADVPMIGIVYDQGPCQVSLLEVDQAESGRLAGSALGALAAKRFDCDVKAYVSLGSGVDDPIGGARMEGYREGYQEHCALPKQVITVNDAQHLVTARTQFAGLLEGLKGKPIMVAGVSEDAILGAMSAAAKRDRSKHVWLSGQMADPVIRKAIACDEHYVASVAHFPGRFGEVAVPAMVAAIEGAEIPMQLQARLELVTAQNVRELFPDTPKCDG